MNLNDIITFIKNNKKFLREQYGVEKIGVFGSYVKNNIKENLGSIAAKRIDEIKSK